MGLYPDDKGSERSDWGSSSVSEKPSNSICAGLEIGDLRGKLVTLFISLRCAVDERRFFIFNPFHSEPFLLYSSIVGGRLML